ncbi:MAG: beta-lactamase family protein [Chloroflexi bacterium]|nr:beta-lactamase family protein [Chloroflexota bacterium]
MTTTMAIHPRVEGSVAHGWEPVRDAFVENFRSRDELGGACAVYHHGAKVVDLWGGVRDAESGAPWEEDTMVLVYSATKGMAALTMALAHSRGWLDYDERVAAYWPEFAQAGKERITIRQLLAHQAGLFGFDEKVDRSVIADPDRLAAIMARQRPAWPPGERQAYHAISLGFYEGEIIRRVDPRHRTLGQVFADEIAAPLGEEFYIRLPAAIPDARLAPLVQEGPVRAILGLPPRMLLDALNPRSVLFRSLIANPGTQVAVDRERIFARDLEIPSGGGVGTARGLAKPYGVFAGDGHELGIAPETLAALRAPATPARRGFQDACFGGGEVAFSLGFMKPTPVWSFGHDGAFGAPGAGGALAYADPATGVGYAYVTNRMGGFAGDPRDVSLREAMERVLAEGRTGA